MVKDNRFGRNIFLDSPAKESHWRLDMSILFIRSNNIRQFIFLGHSCFKTSNIYQLFTVQVVKSKLKQIRNEIWVVSQSFFSMIKIKTLAGPKISVCFSLGNLHLPVLLPCLIHLCCQHGIIYLIFSGLPCVYYEDFLLIAWIQSSASARAKDSR